MTRWTYCCFLSGLFVGFKDEFRLNPQFLLTCRLTFQLVLFVRSEALNRLYVVVIPRLTIFQKFVKISHKTVSHPKFLLFSCNAARESMMDHCIYLLFFLKPDLWQVCSKTTKRSNTNLRRIFNYECNPTNPAIQMPPHVRKLFCLRLLLIHLGFTLNLQKFLLVVETECLNIKSLLLDNSFG